MMDIITNRMSDDNNDTVQQIRNYLTSYGHLVVLLAIFVFGVYTRVQGVQKLRQSGEWLFSGNDAWYHFRATMYTINNYPSLIGFDPMTGYPEGSVNGTFGTLFDLIHATVAMIIGLGSPSEDLVRTVLIYSPPVTMGLIILLTYATAKFMTDSNVAGLIAAFFVSIFPGTLYRRTLVGFSEHHAMEAFLMILTVFTVLRALRMGEEQFVSWDLIKDKDTEALMPWIKSVALAVVAILLYFLTWPPAVVLFAIFGVATVLYTLIGYNEGRAVESTIVTFAVLSLSMFIMVMLRLPELEFSLGIPSLLHAGVTAATFVGVVLVGVLNRYAQSNDWSVVQVLGVMIGFGIVGIGAVALIAPEYISSLFNLILRVLGNPFGIGTESVLTIAEEQPTNLRAMIVGQYGLVLLFSMVGISMLLYDSLKDATSGDRSFSHTVFLFVFSIFMLIISVRTVRYNYYLALFVAVTAAYAIYRFIPYIISTFYSLVDYMAIPDDPAKINVTHFGRGAVAGTIGSILLVILVLSFSMFTLIPVSVSVSPVYQDSVAVGGYTQWEEPLEWMSENTPDDSVERHRKYDESSFEYGDEDYGVMSWWDYGHWITVTGDRVPIANPFQQNAILASEYMLSQTPEEAEETVESQDENANAPKYVAIDWQTANPLSKHGAMVSFNDDYNRSDMYEQYYTQNSQGQVRLAFYQKQQPFYESMVTRLFYAHGSAMEPGTYTANFSVETSRTGENFRVLADGNAIGKQPTVEQAQSLGESPTTISGGIGYTNPPEERVSALEQYRLVTSSSSPYYQRLGNQILPGGYGQRPIYEYSSLIQSMDNETIAQSQPPELIGENPSTVKIFERVEGANVQGSAEPNSVYTARVEMNDPNTNSTFTYRQRVETDSNGDYEFTVPYSTSGYDEVEHPPEVRANSSYELVDSEGNVVQTFKVPESAVIDEGNNTVQVQESN